MSNSAQTPKAEMAERAAESTGLTTAALAVGLQDHQRSLQAHAKRVDESHQAMARAIGMEDVVADNPSDSMGGNITVTGDIHVGSDDQAKVLGKLLGQPQPQPQSEPAKTKMPGWAKVAGAALLGSGLGAGGLAALKALESTPAPPVPVVQQAADRWNEYDIQKWVPESKPETEKE